MGVLFLRYEGVLTPLQTMLLEKIKFELKCIQHFRHQFQIFFQKCCTYRCIQSQVKHLTSGFLQNSHCFPKKPPSEMFDWVLNAALLMT